MPISILVVVNDFSLGGTERTAVRLARAWSKQGAKVTIFCGSGKGPLAALAGPDVQIVRSDQEIGRGAGSRRRLAKASARYLNQNPPDICFVPGNYHWPVVPRLIKAGRKAGAKLVAQISADLRKPQRGRLRQALFDLRMRWLLKDADALVAMARKAALDADKVLSGKTTTIPLPAIEDDAAPPLPIPAGPPVILGAGRLVPEKGFMALLEAFAKLPIAEAQLVIAGTGIEEARLKSRAIGLGIERRVTFLGYVEDIRPALDEARLFVLASQFEGYGAVVIEAVAAGRPVVLTDCTPATELLTDPSVGAIVPIDDVEGLSKGMATMLGRPPPDPEFVAALVAHHRIGIVATMYLDLFERLREARP